MHFSLLLDARSVRALLQSPGNAACRRAKSCRGRAHLCAKRHFPFLPQGVRDWFDLFLAAKYAELPFEDFKEEMEDRKKRKPSLPGAGGLRARGGDPAALLRDANRHLLFVCNLLEREAIPSVFP